jgi:hypothetical protein
MFGDARHSSREVAPNQPQSIRAKIRVWRALMRREADIRKNFFIAKNHDSESARRRFEWIFACLAMSIAQRSSISRITKTTSIQAFPAILRR